MLLLYLIAGEAALILLWPLLIPLLFVWSAIREYIRTRR